MLFWIFLNPKDQEPENIHFLKSCILSNSQKCGNIPRNVLYNSGLCSVSINVAWNSFHCNHQCIVNRLCAKCYLEEMHMTLLIFGTIICPSFLDNDVENDLQSDISWTLQDALRKAEGMQLLLNSCAPGFSEPNLGSLGLSAAKKDPPSEVLPGSQCCLQLL